MSGGNVLLLLLPDWVQQHVQEIYTANTPEDFDTAFDAFIAQNARIQFNGKPISREEYKKTIRGETTGLPGSAITFTSVVSVQDPNSELVRLLPRPASPPSFHLGRGSDVVLNHNDVDDVDRRRRRLLYGEPDSIDYTYPRQPHSRLAERRVRLLLTFITNISANPCVV